MFEQEENHTQPMFLKFTTQVHPFPFLDSVVEVAVMLCSDSGRIIAPGREVPFRICLQHSDDMHSILDNTAMEVLNPSAQVVCGKTGKSPAIRIRLLTPSRSQRDLFVLTVFPTQGVNASIAPFSSSLFQIVRNRIEICNEEQIQTVWFKDEGGKGNQITLQVRLVNSQGQTVRNRSGFRLKCELLYEDGEVVSDQSILKISDDTNMFLDSHGQATIRYQIKEISQNHDCRKFKVKVFPDTFHNPANCDTSHHYTPDILVKSKISKKNRAKMLLKQKQQEEEEAAAALALASAQKAIGMVGSKRKCTGVGVGGDVRSISPVDMTAKGAEGGGGAVTSLALLQFSDMAVTSLLALQQQLRQQAPASSATTTTTTPTLSPLAVIDDILAYHSSLGLPLPSSSISPSSNHKDSQHVSFDEAYDHVFASSSALMELAEADMTDMDTDTDTHNTATVTATAGGDDGGYDGFRLTARAPPGFSDSHSHSLGPEPTRENSLFRQAACTMSGSVSLGPEAVRQNSLFLPLPLPLETSASSGGMVP